MRRSLPFFLTVMVLLGAALAASTEGHTDRKSRHNINAKDFLRQIASQMEAIEEGRTVSTVTHTKISELDHKTAELHRALHSTSQALKKAHDLRHHQDRKDLLQTVDKSHALIIDLQGSVRTLQAALKSNNALLESEHEKVEHTMEMLSKRSKELDEAYLTIEELRRQILLLMKRYSSSHTSVTVMQSQYEAQQKKLEAAQAKADAQADKLEEMQEKLANKATAWAAQKQRLTDKLDAINAAERKIRASLTQCPAPDADSIVPRSQTPLMPRLWAKQDAVLACRSATRCR